jgi:hypothetical protein
VGPKSLRPIAALLPRKLREILMHPYRQSTGKRAMLTKAVGCDHREKKHLCRGMRLFPNNALVLNINEFKFV